MSKKKQKTVVHIEDDLDNDTNLRPLKSRYIQILIILTSIAFILRFYNLGFNSLWLDEATTNLISLKSFGEIWQTVISGEFNPPLFYWLEHVVILIFGNSEFMLRWMPAIFGVLTVPVVYFVGTEFKNENVGILTAAAFAFSPFLIIYSQEARSYSMMLFFISLAVLFYLKAMNTNFYKWWILFGVFSAIAFWSHFYAFVMIASCMIHAVVMNYKFMREDKDYIRPFIASVVIFIILSLPLIIVTVDLFGKRTSTAPTYGIQGIGVIIESFNQVLGYSSISVILFLLLFIIGIFTIDRKNSVFLMWSVISIFAVSYVLSFKIPMIPRYLQFLTLILFMGAAMSYKLFYMIRPTRMIIYSMILLFFVVSIPFYMGYYSTETKTDWRGFSGIMENIKPGDSIVFVPNYIETPVDYYYSNKTHGTFIYGANSVNDLVNITSGGNSIYYIMTGDIMAVDPTGSTSSWVTGNAKLISQRGEIYLFVR